MSERSQIRLKREFSILAHTPDHVELRSGVWSPTSYSLRDESGTGKLFAVLAGLDGTRSLRDLAREHDTPRADVEALVDHLLELGVVESGPSSALDAYLDGVAPLLRRAPGEAHVQRPVLLVGSTPLVGAVAELLRPSLPEGSVEMVDEGDPRVSLLHQPEDWRHDGLRLQEIAGQFTHWIGRFVVLLQEQTDPLLAANMNRIACELGIPWMQGALDGPMVLVGPVFVGGRGPCYECLETRVWMNMREKESYHRYKRALVERKVARAGAPPLVPALRAVLAGHVAMEVMNFVLTGSAFTRGKVLTLYLPTMEITFNEVLRVPGCPACGAVGQRDDHQLYFDAHALLAEAAQ